MEHRCSNCDHFSFGVPDFLRNKYDSNWSAYADGLCHLIFPRGYLGSDPPHLARSQGRCFQWSGRSIQISFLE